MKKIKHDAGLFIVKMLNIIFMTAAIGLCWSLYYNKQMLHSYYTHRGSLVIYALFFVLYIVFERIYDAFQISMNRISEMIYSQCLAILFSDTVMFFVVFILLEKFPDIIPALITLAAQILFAVIWSVAAHTWYFKVFPPVKSVIVFDSRLDIKDLIDEYGLDNKFTVEKSISIEECLADLDVLSEYETVFLSGVHSKERNVVLKYCISSGIRTYVIPRIGDVLMSSAKKVHMFHLPMLQVERYRPSLDFLILKRIGDIIFSVIGLIITSPIFLAVAIAIKATDHGPVFYKQERYTKDSKVFKVIKFRSMRVDAEKDGVARLSTGDNDDRITPVGKIIRKVRIDELPQLINILKGEMSFVGPRPERPEIAAQYEEDLPEFALRLQAKAGLTGYAQVYGKYNTSPYDKLQMDLMYIANPRMSQDISIVLATIKILFIPDSTEGIAEGQTTAMGTSKDDAELSVK